MFLCKGVTGGKVTVFCSHKSVDKMRCTRTRRLRVDCCARKVSPAAVRGRSSLSSHCSPVTTGGLLAVTSFEISLQCQHLLMYRGHGSLAKFGVPFKPIFSVAKQQ
jgi:hypothetical protein